MHFANIGPLSYKNLTRPVSLPKGTKNGLTKEKESVKSKWLMRAQLM